jgi:hypothetical protein
MEISKLSINKKITAFFVDGSQKMNLGVAAVVDLLKGAERVQVQIAPVKRAERLLTDLAETSGRIVEKADEGVFLAQPAVDAPTVEEIVTQPVVEEIARAETAVVAGPEPAVAVKGKVVRKYRTLSRTFFNGSLRGQILSVYKTREINPEKISDFKAALAAGDITWGDTPLPKALVEKATALGIEVPVNLVV